MPLPTFPNSISLLQISNEMQFSTLFVWGGTIFTQISGTNTWTSTNLIRQYDFGLTGFDIKFDSDPLRTYRITRSVVNSGIYGPPTETIEFSVTDGWTPTGSATIGFGPSPGTSRRMSSQYQFSRVTGYPNGIPTLIPSSGQISFGNFHGAQSLFNISFSMFGIYGASSCCSDNDYFGGDIPRTFSWITRRSNQFKEFSIPSNYSQVKLTMYSWSVQLGCGYSYYDGGAYSSTDYYYDYMKNFGIEIVNFTDGGVSAGKLINTTDQNQYSGPYYNTYTVPDGSLDLQSGKTYRAYYVCDFYRASDIGYGDSSFGWYNNGTPFINIDASS